MVTDVVPDRDAALLARADPGSPSVLRDYALVADGLRGALVDEGGEVAWLCFPGWSDEALFASLLGGRGSFRVAPRGRGVTEGRYEEGSLVWHTRWVRDRGLVDLRTALAYPGERDRCVLLRRVEAIGAPAEIELVLEPARDYGRAGLGPWSLEGDAWVVRGERTSMRLTGVPMAEPDTADPSRLLLRQVVEPSEELDVVLEICRGSGAGFRRVHPSREWRHTRAAWGATTSPKVDTIAPADVRRACALLRGMTTPEGATMAAATTSLPERDEAHRNYDYRYSWIRDTCYVGYAGAALEGGELMLDDAVRWVTERLLQDGERLMPAYLPDGGSVPDVQQLGLPGYPGGAEDVIGNQVRTQFQLDGFGEALLLFSKAAAKGRLDADGWRAAQVATRAIGHRLDDLENGVWETEPRHWTHSRLVCVAGLRAIAAQEGVPGALGAAAEPLARHVLAELERTGVHRSGRWRRADDDDRIDASLLLGEVRGALGSDDPRSTATRDAVRDELSQEGFVYRYVHRGRPLGEGEGAFLICNFWMALSCLGVGDTAAAASWFERARSSCGSPGLLSEEYDVQHHQLRGNLPQAFVHALLVETAASDKWG